MWNLTSSDPESVPTLSVARLFNETTKVERFTVDIDRIMNNARMPNDSSSSRMIGSAAW